MSSILQIWAKGMYKLQTHLVHENVLGFLRRHLRKILEWKPGPRPCFSRTPWGMRWLSGNILAYCYYRFPDGKSMATVRMSKTKNSGSYLVLTKASYIFACEILSLKNCFVDFHNASEVKAATVLLLQCIIGCYLSPSSYGSRDSSQL